jgi:hypothetical protein
MADNLFKSGLHQPITGIFTDTPVRRLASAPASSTTPSEPPAVQPVQPPLSRPSIPAIPPAPVANPFGALPFRSPGDRIKADDFNALAKSLQIIGDAYVLSGALFGVPFAQAKLVLASQRYEIERVMTVFGTEIDAPSDTSVDDRKVILLVPVILGERRVLVVVTEAVETRRLAPNLLGLTYREAFERQRAVMGEGTFPSTPISAVSLVSQSLRDAAQLLTR